MFCIREKLKTFNAQLKHINVNQFKKQCYKMVMTPYVSKTNDLKDRPILAGPITPMQVLHSLIEKILK